MPDRNTSEASHSATAAGDALPTRTRPGEQFTLRALMIFMAVVAVGLALCVQLGMIGAVLVWLVAAGFTLETFQRNIESLSRVRMLLWGVAMPIVCLAFDPTFIQQGLFNKTIDTMPLMKPDWRRSEWGPDQLMSYGLLVFQMCGLIVWVFAGHSLVRGASFLAGALWLGFLIALGAAVVLLVPGFIGIAFYGMGLLGWTPIFTAVAFHRARKAARQQSLARDTRRNRLLWGSYGVAAAILLPLGLGGLAWLVAA